MSFFSYLSGSMAAIVRSPRGGKAAFFETNLQSVLEAQYVTGIFG
jgi:hypothetical protein